MKLYGTGAGWCRFLNDHLGAPQKVVDSAGQVVWEAGYMPFGEARVLVADVVNNLRFPGQYYDSETGFHYNWHRYYDPDTGRYLTPDPIGLEGGMNLYAYVQNNPVNYVDPYGTDAIYINYDHYPVSTPIGKLPLGHGAVVAVDPSTGTTKYYEFGRYGDPKGVVRGAPDIKVPNVIIGKDGLPTQESLNHLYDFLSHNFGHDVHVSPTLYVGIELTRPMRQSIRFKKVCTVLSARRPPGGQAAARSFRPRVPNPSVAGSAAASSEQPGQSHGA
ncbi:MAG: RHS repeat-associated core domain-containing protein [Desulfococcaceae bacterium]